MTHRWSLLPLSLALAAVSPASTIFYGGDWESNGFFFTAGTTAQYFDDFDIVAPTLVNGGWIHELRTSLPSSAAYRAFIRSGVDVGQPGTQLLFEEGLCESVAATGRTSSSGLLEVRGTIGGLSLLLQPGKYWFAGVLFSGGDPGFWTGIKSYGGNAVGGPILNNNALIYDPFTMQNYVALNADISFGIVGTVVPEPASLSIFGVGALLFNLKRKRI